MALFVRDAERERWVNLERAHAIEVVQNPDTSEWWTLATFAGRSVRVGRPHEDERGAARFAEELSARANAGSR